MRRALSALAATVSLLFLLPGAHAASLSYFGATDPPALGLAINQLIGNINAGITPSSMAPFATFRNVLDNGAMAVQQRGTAAATGGTTSGCAVATYFADRWCVDTNVASGAGFGQASTSGGPPDLPNYLKVYRNSGSLTQPVCAIQEIPTATASQLAGQNVVLSFYATAFTGMGSANTLSTYIISGTGSDQGLGSVTTSPAITPAWTGIAGGSTALGAGVGSASMTLPVPTSGTNWQRIWTAPFSMPANATEAGVEICFTPGAETAGATDGFGLTGVQLEALPGSTSLPSSFEMHPYLLDLLIAQRYYWQLAEPAANTIVGICQATGASAQLCMIDLPVTMRAAPTVAITTGTFKENIAGTATTWVSPAAGTMTPNEVAITAGNTTTAGQAVMLQGGGGTGLITASADF